MRPEPWQFFLGVWTGVAIGVVFHDWFVSLARALF